jgi:hypothetical protein
VHNGTADQPVAILRPNMNNFALIEIVHVLCDRNAVFMCSLRTARGGVAT